jgi:vitamin B12 transporter
MNRVLSVLFLLLGPLAGLARPALAADAGVAGSDAGVPEAGSAPPAVEAPRLLEAAPAVAPPAEAAVTGVVTLQLALDETGLVTGAEVIEGLSPGLDSAARQAALRSRFRPAHRRGVPVASRIRYVVSFAPPSPAPALPPPPPPPPSPPAARPSSERVTDVTVRGTSAAQRLRESAEAVTVIETRQARRESADLGEVVARSQGVSLRRTGGLGSHSQFSLNGFTGDQVRFFLDGVPLDLVGFGGRLASVPVNLIDRVEVYKGVVPVRFGADALGGAVNLVSLEAPRGTRMWASGELGSFGTYRVALSGRAPHQPTGLYLALDGFLDHADNDYPVDVEVPDERGRLSPARVYRYHDAYDAYGGGLEVGLTNRPWASKLSLRLFGNRYDKELQNNVVMSVPYGEAEYWEAARGATLRHELSRVADSDFSTSVVLAVGRQVVDWEDLARHVYDWFGRRIRERVRAGELGEPADERVWQHTAIARLALSWSPVPEHTVTVASAPTLAERTGRDYLITMGRDPLSAERRYLALIDGIEYRADLLDRRLEVITFGKSYLFATRSEEPLPGNIFRQRHQDSHNLGAGASLRLRLVRPLWLKASYERATRLPSPYEIFGDGVLILANLGLLPEQSHNANLSLTLDWGRTRAGDFRAELNGFFRQADNLIVLLGNDMVFSYQNVYTARSQGLEAGAGWTSPGSYLSVDGNLTWQSLRNHSDEGTFRDFKGDRIPNRPWLFANLSARLQKPGVSGSNDALSLAYHLRYVNSFYRGWESLGLREFKQVVPDQTTHTLALTYLARGRLTQSWTAEIQNLTDARTFDYFGVQRPGRAFFAKVTAEF